MPSSTIPTPMNVAPRGFPRCLSDVCERAAAPYGAGAWCEHAGHGDAKDVLRRKSWVMAMPMDAKDSDVRSQARNVRSGNANACQHSLYWRPCRPHVSTYPALNGPAQRCPCSRAPRCRTYSRRRASARRPRARRRRRRVAWRGRVCLGCLARGTWCRKLWCAGRSAGRLGGFRQGGRAWWRGGNRFYGVVFCYAIDATVEAGAELAGEVIRPRGNISRARELGLRSNTPAVACMLGYRMHG
jgi:hypothetical protein